MINDKLGAELESTGPQKPIELKNTDYPLINFKVISARVKRQKEPKYQTQVLKV
jgi:hypothetical protein